jgi:hypothetical protein
MDQQSKKELPKKEFYDQLDEDNKVYEASNELHDMETRSSLTDHEHYLDVQPGNVAECQCGWGIYLDAEDEIREGKLYRNGTLII